jgi:hypothetical protein
MLVDRLVPLPEGIAETARVLAHLDDCFRSGFVGGQQQEALASVARIFAGTPLAARLAESVRALGQGEFQEAHFVSLAAARAALQGAQYDTLRGQACAALGRAPDQDDIAQVSPPAPLPLLDSARHWLMELAITGFARLEASALLPFLTTLAQLRAQPGLLHVSTLLTGFANELLAALPIAQPDQVPLLRWCDLWSAAILGAAGAAAPPVARPVTGTLYPLGVDLREHPQMVSAVFYGVLVADGAAEFVRQTWSRFKVAAIRGDEIWLLVPDAAPWLESLAQGKALDVQNIGLLPTGDLLWVPGAATLGKKYKLLETAAHYFAPHAAEEAIVRPLPPLERHPVQIAEPVALAGCTLHGERVQTSDGAEIALDMRRNAGAELTLDELAKTTALFGLLRYDAGQWALQPLAAGASLDKAMFAGQNGAKLFKKPPKNSAVAILEERASRLLRG